MRHRLSPDRTRYRSDLVPSGAATGVAGGLFPGVLWARAQDAGELYLYNWANYFPPELIETFEQDTGINVTLDVYDSNETMLAKLQAGGLVHRLDRPASGLMVLARTSNAARHLSRQFRERTVTKRYLALVEGTAVGIGTCEDYLRKDGRHMRVTSPDDPDAQHAVLEWQSMAQGGRASLLQVRLRTGRRHQIRVQLAHRGYPIWGDMRYGATHELDGQNLALHAYHLAIEHPLTTKGTRWTVPVPAVWHDALHDNHRAAIERLLATA